MLPAGSAAPATLATSSAVPGRPAGHFCKHIFIKTSSGAVKFHQARAALSIMPGEIEFAAHLYAPFDSFCHYAFYITAFSHLIRIQCVFLILAGFNTSSCSSSSAGVNTSCSSVSEFQGAPFCAQIIGYRNTFSTTGFDHFFPLLSNKTVPYRSTFKIRFRQRPDW